MANLPYTDYDSIRTDGQIEVGDWKNVHSVKVQNAAAFPETDYNEKYNTMVTSGLVRAITYYRKHPEQARAVKDSTEYPFAARAARLALSGPDYKITKTGTVVESAPPWGGSKRFKKKSRRRRNRKTTRRRRRKY